MIINLKACFIVTSFVETHHQLFLLSWTIRMTFIQDLLSARDILSYQKT